MPRPQAARAPRSCRLSALALILALLCSALAGSRVVAARVQPLGLAHLHDIAAINPERPLLAFYYMWYGLKSWSLSTMSDLPTIRYDSGDDATISRQLTWAAHAGITGFIASWWGPGDPTDRDFGKLLAHAAGLEHTTGYHFASTIYLEIDAPALTTEPALVQGLRYVLAHYGNDSHFFHWQGKPVVFIWDPLGHGRTLATWAAIRAQVDPHHA